MIDSVAGDCWFYVQPNAPSLHGARMEGEREREGEREEESIATSTEMLEEYHGT